MIWVWLHQNYFTRGIESGKFSATLPAILPHIRRTQVKVAS